MLSVGLSENFVKRIATTTYFRIYEIKSSETFYICIKIQSLNSNNCITHIFAFLLNGNCFLYTIGLLNSSFLILEVQKQR